ETRQNVPSSVHLQALQPPDRARATAACRFQNGVFASMFARMSVALRVYGAFGALIFLLCLLGLAGGLGLQSVAGTFVEYRGLARQTLEINDYAVDLAAARRLSLQYQ